MFNVNMYYYNDIKVVYILCYRLVCILIRFVIVDFLFYIRNVFFIVKINEEVKKIIFVLFVIFDLRFVIYIIL